MHDIKTIWNEDDFIDVDDIRDDYPDSSDRELEEIANELHYGYLEDEKANLNIEVPGIIVCFGDIGRWNGRFSGYKPVGTNVADILRPLADSNSYCHWYLDVDTDDICGKEAHHDATNYYTYREVTTEDLQLAEEQDHPVDWLKERSKSISSYVKNVYGW